MKHALIETAKSVLYGISSVLEAASSSLQFSFRSSGSVWDIQGKVLHVFLGLIVRCKLMISSLESK